MLITLVCCKNRTTNERVSETIVKSDSTESVKDTVIYNTDTIQIYYKNKIENYTVSVKWIPREANCVSVDGNAYISFKHNSGTSFIVHHKFFSSDLCSYDTTNGLAILPKERTFKINYPLNTKNEYLRKDVPFYFADVNFDGKKELILVNYGEGQRLCNSYSVYALNNQYGLVDSTEQITNQEPYKYFDSMTEFNRKNKTILIYLSGGAVNYEYRTYKYKNGKMALRQVEGREMDSIYNFHYN